MDKNYSIINVNLSGLGEVGKALVEVCKKAVVGYCKPNQMIRLAEAEAEVAKIEEQARIETTDMGIRAVNRWITEETIKQRNMESIMFQAARQLDYDAESKDVAAKPEQVEDDWIMNFFDKCRLFSDGDMQELWSKILAGEANAPGAYTKRTVNLLGSFDREDAKIFQRLCRFAWRMDGRWYPMVFDLDAAIYVDHEISFDTLKHLDEIGLLTFNQLRGFAAIFDSPCTISYYSTPLSLEVGTAPNSMPVGNVLLSQSGQELANLCQTELIPAFIDYCISRWNDISDRRHGCRFVLSSSYPRVVAD